MRATNLHNIGMTLLGHPESLDLAELKQLAEDGKFRELRTRWGEKTHRYRSHRDRIVYQGAELALDIFYSNECCGARLARFMQDFKSELHRDFKHKKSLRDIFLFLDLDYDLAGARATALAEACRTRVPSEQIKAYVERNGGFEQLIAAERGLRRSKGSNTDVLAERLQISTSEECASNIRAIGEGELWARVQVRRTRNGAGTSLKITAIVKDDELLTKLSDHLEQASSRERVRQKR